MGNQVQMMSDFNMAMNRVNSQITSLKDSNKCGNNNDEIARLEREKGVLIGALALASGWVAWGMETAASIGCGALIAAPTP